jgi:hypothetical protein
MNDSSKPEAKPEWVMCNSCLIKTKHDVLKHHTQADSEIYYDNDNDGSPQGDIWWQTDYHLLECRGCATVTLRRQFTFSEWDEFTGPEIEFYPPKVSRRKPDWVSSISEEMQELLQEIYTALHADSRRLALMGTRTIIDMLMLEKVGDLGSFKEKLKKLELDGYLGQKNRETLDAALEAGHAAAHRSFKPTAEQLTSVIDIVENLLHSIYILDSAGEKLKKITPERLPRTVKTKHSVSI